MIIKICVPFQVHKMNIHCFQHVPFEGIGAIGEWITKNHHVLTYTKFYEEYSLPDINDIDFLIIMGGPMGVYDELKFDWLAFEKAFIQKAIKADKIILGVCLGSQLLAEVLGAKVYPNNQKEIGWFPVSFNSGFQTYSDININSDLNVFHWHGDTFDLPEGALLLSSSSACRNQLFSFNGKVIGIQYHLEATPEAINAFVENCGDELVPGKEFIQSKKQILETIQYIQQSNQLMFDILDRLVKI